QGVEGGSERPIGLCAREYECLHFGRSPKRRAGAARARTTWRATSTPVGRETPRKEGHTLTSRTTHPASVCIKATPAYSAPTASAAASARSARPVSTSAAWPEPPRARLLLHSPSAGTRRIPPRSRLPRTITRRSSRADETKG